jgi:hypothetical protein
MNICFFQDTVGIGGGEIWAANAAERLREKGHTATIGCPSGSWLEQRASTVGIPYFDYLVDPEFEDSLSWQLVEHLQEYDIDVVCCGIPGSRTEVPIIDGALREVGRGGILVRLGVSPGPGALTPQQLGIGYDTVRGIIVVSQDIKRNLIRQFESLDPARTHVIYNGVDLEQFDPAAYNGSQRSDLRTQFDIPEDHVVVGAVGRLDPIKNLPALVHAAADLLQEHPQTTFLVVGDGVQKQDLVASARDKGVLDRFRFAGFVEDMPRLMHGIDVLAHASLSEGVPNCVLEAMAMGKAVVATRVGGIPELIEHEVHGILVAPDSAEDLARGLTSVIGDPARMKSLGRDARTRIEADFDRGQMLGALESLVRQEFIALRNRKLSRITTQPRMHDLPDLYFERACAMQRIP